MAERAAPGLVLAMAAVLVPLAGCATRRLPAPVPMSAEEQARLLRDPTDHRRHFLKDESGGDRIWYSGSFRLHDGQRDVLPMRVRNPSRPVVAASVRPGADDGIVLIDPSSRQSWMTSGQAANQRAPVLGPRVNRAAPDHVDQDIPGFAVVAERFHFDRLTVSDAVLLALAARGPLGELSRGTAGGRNQPDLVMGADFIRAFSFVAFDFPNRSVFLSASDPYPDSGPQALGEAPLTFPGGRIAARGRVDGEAADVVLDLAGAFSMVRTGVEPGTPVRQVSLGTFVLRNLAADPPEAHGLRPLDEPRLGAAALQPYRVVLDIRRRVVWFERPE